MFGSVLRPSVIGSLLGWPRRIVRPGQTGTSPLERGAAIETDYLVVGAGASGMGFVDTFSSRSDAEILIVDRRHRPGGHWNDDYGFVRLHQPSAYYGVDSLSLGEDRIDETGPNAGFYERASGAEVVDYYSRVLEEKFLPTGRIKFLPMTDYLGESSGVHNLTSLLTGKTTSVRVRRKVVDATYIATNIPSMHKPPFSVDPGVRLVPPNGLVHLSDPAEAFTIIGAGKTSMDTVCWLVDQGVDADSIRWIRPRDPWFVDRRWMQSLSFVGSMAEWLARQTEAMAEAADSRDLLRLFEEKDVYRRLDPSVEPAIFHGAILSELEHTTIQQIKDVVRMGHVQHVGTDSVALAEGSISTRTGEVFVDCSAHGLGTPPTRPIFEAGRITIQRSQVGIDPFNGALIGVVEASDRTDDEKNRLCPPNQMTGEVDHLALDLLISTRARASWFAEPDIRKWQSTTRLSPFRDSAIHLDDQARATVMRMIAATPAAIENLERIVAAGQ